MAQYDRIEGNPLGGERKDIRYIRDVLWPEFLEQFIRDNREYPEERPLGARAEWHGMHRKVGKLKAPVWDGKEWTGRESVRRMFQEIIGHAFLAIASLDYDGANCSTECAEAHTYGVGCSVGRMLRKPKMDVIPPALAALAQEAKAPFEIRPGKLVPVEDTKPLAGWGGGHSRVPGRDLCGAIAVGGRCRLPRGHNKGYLDVPERHDAHPAPADETEAYTEQRRVRAERAESRSEATEREAAAWRVRHCGPGCAYEHRYSGECTNQE